MRKIIGFLKYFTFIFSILILILIVITLIFPITRQLYFYHLGFKLTYYGFNDLGPKIGKYGLPDNNFLFGEPFRSFSVQNTKNGNYHLAIDALEEAVKRNPSIKEYYGWVLLYYYRDYNKSYQILDEYDKKTPNFSDPVIGENVNYLKGLALMKMNRFEEAIKEFNIYIDYVSNSVGEDWVDVYAFVNRGNSYVQINEFERAINDYNTAIRNYTTCSEAYFYKAQTLLKLNNIDSALISAKKSHNLITVGHYKHEDTYIEYFHEIYPVQVKRLINEIETLKNK